MEIDLQQLVPLACKWVVLKEAEIFKVGLPLPDELKAFASRIGIKNTERIKVLLVEKIPLPENHLLQHACRETGLISINTIGLTLNYGILIKKDYEFERSIYKHELGHVLQYEQLGGIGQFLNKYLYEVLTYGYLNAPMEIEARGKEIL